VADGVPKGLAASGGSLAQERLELGEDLLASRSCWTGPLQGADDPAAAGSWIEVGRVRRQVEEAGAGSGDGFSNACHLVGGQVVHEAPAGASSDPCKDACRSMRRHHHVTWEQRRHQELLDIGREGRTGHRPVRDERGDDAAGAQPGEEGGDVPMTVWSGINQALSPRPPTAAADHVAASTGLIQEHEADRIEMALPDPPALAAPGYVRSILLGRPQRLFWCDSPSRRRVDQIVVKEPASMPRRINSAWIWAE
jgi:hypothetical protein